MENYSVEIGTIHGQFGEKPIRVKAVYHTMEREDSMLGMSRFKGSLIGFELDQFIMFRDEKGLDVEAKVYIPRAAVDRLCGMMTSELQAHERREADDRIRRER